jgi:hypothetical protein
MTRWEHHKNHGLARAPLKKAPKSPGPKEFWQRWGKAGAGKSVEKIVLPPGGLPMLHRVAGYRGRGRETEEAAALAADKKAEEEEGGLRAEMQLLRRAHGAGGSVQKAQVGAGGPGVTQVRGNVAIASETWPLLRTAAAGLGKLHAEPVREALVSGNAAAADAAGLRRWGEVREFARGMGVRGGAEQTRREAPGGVHRRGLGGDVVVSSAASRRMGAVTYQDDQVPVPNAMGAVPLDEEINELPRDLPHLAQRVEGLLNPLSTRVHEIRARQNSLGSAQEQVRQMSSAMDSWRRHVAEGKPAGQRPDADTGAALGPEGAKYLRQLLLQHAHPSPHGNARGQGLGRKAATREGAEGTEEHSGSAVGAGGLARGRDSWDAPLGKVHQVVRHAESGLRRAWRAFDSVLRLD